MPLFRGKWLETKQELLLAVGRRAPEPGPDVIPAKAGIQADFPDVGTRGLDSRFRGNDAGKKRER
jgi:hypothetical protein